MKHTLTITVLLTFAFSIAISQENDPFVRFPDINPAGTEVAFEYQGDIWKVPIEGGLAWRLTIHEGYDAYPKWSNDGSSIAFSGMRFGNYDVFLTTANGGYPRQLTYHSTGDVCSGWTPDGNILFSTRRTFAQVEREFETYEVSPDGGTPYRIMDALGRSAEFSPNKKFIVFVKGSCKTTREDYRGPAQKDIWIYDVKHEKYNRLTTFDGNDFMPHFVGNNAIYYISPKSGKYNIWKMEIDDSGNFLKETQITNYTDDGIRYFSVNKTGEHIVFEKQTHIYHQTLSSGKAKKIDIQISPDYHFDPVENKTFSGNISEYTLSPNGKYAAMVIRGEIFITQVNDKKKTVAITDSPWRDRSPVWLNDSTLLFTSDRNGQYDIYLARSSDEAETDLFKTLKRQLIRVTNTPQDEMHLVVSPDGKKLAFESGFGKLITAEISEKNKLINETILHDDWSSPYGVAWSPDSKWLAYSVVDLSGNHEIFIQAADNSQGPVNVSMHPRGDRNPVWSNDGSKLGFLSNRNNNDYDAWFVWLQKSDWEKTMQDWEEQDDDDTKKSEKNDDGGVEPVHIDFDRIHERLEQVTGLPGNESDLVISDDGETFFFVTNRNARQSYKAENDLYSIKWNGKELKQITKKNQKPYAVSLSPDGKKITLLKSGGKLYTLDPKSAKQEPVAFAANMKINYAAEQEQIFEEAWRSLNQRFYDPDFHGKDWTKLKKKYKPMAMKASTYFDFRDITNYMLGELNASHMDLRGGRGRYETQNITTGRPGIEVKPVKTGVEITDVVFNAPADKTNSKLYPGEVITKVNGVRISEDINFWQMLNGEANHEVLLEIEGKDGIREVVIRPLASLSTELYEDWVEQRRKLTEQYSGGRLGYLHIRGMNWTSFERFERDLAAAGNGKEGIVIDVRFNGGGWTTDYLMAVLNVDQHAYCVPRGAIENLEKEHKNFRPDYPFGERLPYYAWTKPSIAMCNENSYSNAEIFSHAYKTLGIGTLVGQPTFGAVISTGANGLLDGSYIRLPFRAWYVKATDENMENGPAVPDILVETAPDAKAKGKDEQLKKAVEQLLEEIDNSSGQ